MFTLPHFQAVWQLDAYPHGKTESSQNNPYRIIQSNDQSISSKTFILSHLQAVWQLDVYPQIRKANFDYSYFVLRLTGFQEPDSFSPQMPDFTKTIVADYNIFLLSNTNKMLKISKKLSEFKIGTAEGVDVWAEDIKKFIHPDGSLLVICEVECLTPEETFSLESSTNPELLDQNLDFIDHIGKMWKSKLFTDCTLEVGAKRFPAHKCILGQWSEVFRNMFSLPLEEAKNGIVEITDFGPETISAMLEYMYTGQVKNDVMEKVVADLLALADKYDVIPLKELCEVFLASKLTTLNNLQMAIFADRVSAAKLKKACANRFAIDGRAVLQSKEWEELKSENKDLANELLELMIKDNPSFGVMQEETTKDAK